MRLTNDHGLWVDADTNTCVGYLINFQEHGVFDPNGKKDISPETIDEHNRILSEAEIKGLDENCQLQQRGMFYYTAGKGVHTWIGTIVAPPEDCIVRGQSITFFRKNKSFRGRLHLNDNLFEFKRIA